MSYSIQTKRISMEYGKSVPKEPKCLKRQFDPKKNALTTKNQSKEKTTWIALILDIYIYYIFNQFYEIVEKKIMHLKNNAFDAYQCESCECFSMYIHGIFL